MRVGLAFGESGAAIVPLETDGPSHPTSDFHRAGELAEQALEASPSDYLAHCGKGSVLRFQQAGPSRWSFFEHCAPRSHRNFRGPKRRIAAKGVTLKILDPPVDTSTAPGRLTFNLFASIAQFAREIMLERQREGIAAAKAKRLYKGRKPTARMQAEEIKRLKAEGVSNAEIARRLGVHRSNVGRVLAP